MIGGSENNKTFLFKNQSAGSELAIQAVDDSGVGGGNLFKFTRSGKSVQTFEGYKDGAAWFEVANASKEVTVEGTVKASSFTDLDGNPVRNAAAVETFQELQVAVENATNFGELKAAMLVALEDYKNA